MTVYDIAQLIPCMREIAKADIPKKDRVEMIKGILSSDYASECIVYKVTYRMGLNKGYYENGGSSYFATDEDADGFVEEFESVGDGQCDEPEEICLMCVDDDVLIEILLGGIE